MRPHREEAHVPGLHARSAKRASGKRSVPIWVTDDGRVLGDSTDIVVYLDAHVRARVPSRGPAPHTLYPTDPVERSEAETLEELFDAEVGVASRAWAYDHLLSDPRRLVAICGTTMNLAERMAFRGLAWPLSLIIRRDYRIPKGSADRHLERLRVALATVEERLESGRSYLVGERFSIADLAFAALAAPALMPEQHPAMSSNVDLLPPTVAALVKDLRNTRAGKHALRMYREHRATAGAGGA